MLAGDDAAVVDVELFAVAEFALFVGLVEDRRAVERVHDLHELVRVAHLVLVNDVGLRAGDDALQHRLGEQREARLGAEDLLLELVDAVLEIAQPHAVGAASIGSADVCVCALGVVGGAA